MDMLEEAVKYIMLGFLYKFIIAHILGRPYSLSSEESSPTVRWFFNHYALAVMYTFGLELFFDFAGWLYVALAISNLMGIHSPINFNKPFI